MDRMALAVQLCKLGQISLQIKFTILRSITNYFYTAKITKSSKHGKPYTFMLQTATLALKLKKYSGYRDVSFSDYRYMKM